MAGSSSMILPKYYTTNKTSSDKEQDEKYTGNKRRWIVSYQNLLYAESQLSLKSNGNEMMNYSGTHVVDPHCLYKPINSEEVQNLVFRCNNRKEKIRPVGRFLSPNGIGRCHEGMISLENCDKIINIDEEKQQITVEAGAIIQSILTELAKYNLTLSNFSSIKEQQLGGWTQVAAHGTGATIPTVDEMIVQLKVVTPGCGLLIFSRDSPNCEERELFKLVRSGLGSLGIVTEMTLQCTKAHWLREVTETISSSDGSLRKRHADLLRDYRHVRYMWIPYTDVVVVAKANPIKENNKGSLSEQNDFALEPLRLLLRKSSKTSGKYDDGDGLSFSQLRDKLLDVSPLDTQYVKIINQAEAKFWQRFCGVREGPSDEILGFDCGGQQWVLELCFPVGTLDDPTYKDIEFVTELKKRLERANIPAPAPIEQRWSSASSSYMSPTYSENHEDLFTWVGIIMYMPSGQNKEQRSAITAMFEEYTDIMYELGRKYGAVPHWAKIELPKYSHRSFTEKDAQKRLDEMRDMIHQRYDVKRFNSARAKLDPMKILSNEIIEKLFD